MIFTVGLPAENGKRKDYQELFKKVRSGVTDLEIAEWNFQLFASTLRAIDRVRFLVRPVLPGPRQVILNWGATGTGKTRSSYERYPNLFELPIGKDMWFDGYCGQAEVLIDEFDGHLGLTSALKIFDNYYVRSVPIKGSFVWWNPLVIIVTSQRHPSTWYWGFTKGPVAKDGVTTRYEEERALRRRFTSVNEYHSDGTISSYNTEEEIRIGWHVNGDSRLLTNDLLRPPPPNPNTTPPLLVEFADPVNDEDDLYAI